MRIEDRSNRKDRLILQGMITNETVLARIASRWKEHLFDSRWSYLIGSWCVEHYEKFHQPPSKAIREYFDTWAEEHEKEDATIKMLETFLVHLSDEFDRIKEEVNPDQLLDMADKHFEFLRLRRTVDEAKTNLDSGRLEKAQEQISSYNRLNLKSTSGVSLFTNREEVFSVFDQQMQTVIDYTRDPKLKDLNLFFAGRLERDTFVSFMAPEKTGKSWWLLELAWQTMLRRKRVLFLEVGDMSKRQIEERFMVRVAGWPYRSSTGEWPYEMNYPISIKLQQQANGFKQPVLEYEKRTFKKPLNAAKAWEACQKVMCEKVKSKRSFFELAAYPNSTVNAAGIRAVIQDYQTRDWSPDVVIVDYADILADMPGKRDVRDNINFTWKQLRSISQEFHVLLITGTQSDADSYERRTLDRRNFSEDKRKLAHVNGMIGINVTSEEKEQGVMRLNWIVRREGAYATGKCIYLASCLPLANPAVLSTW